MLWKLTIIAMAESVVSRFGISIRLTDERSAHIIEEHGELAGVRADVLDAVESAERVLAGGSGELLATREVTPGKRLVVVYREGNDDGFITTAFLTRRIRSLDRRQQLWP
ncbi:MAG: hypothetical protein ACRDJE_29585 [Dehalococcoidia bacterium]